jgi:hypothetical protein
MRIVNKQDFYKLPAGTICAKYEPQVFGEPFIKGETWEDADGKPFEYLYTPLFGTVDAHNMGEESDILESAEKNGTSFKWDFECSMRDGHFDQDQMYAVWEGDDILSLCAVVNVLCDAYIRDRM